VSARYGSATKSNRLLRHAEAPISRRKTGALHLKNVRTARHSIRRVSTGAHQLWQWGPQFSSSRRNGQRDETKLFNARNSAETELSYGSGLWPLVGLGFNLIDL
jgi:hypothetical protein